MTVLVCFHCWIDSYPFVYADGNGFKTSTMRLGVDAIVFTQTTCGRCFLFFIEAKNNPSHIIVFLEIFLTNITILFYFASFLFNSYKFLFWDYCQKIDMKEKLYIGCFKQPSISNISIPDMEVLWSSIYRDLWPLVEFIVGNGEKGKFICSCSTYSIWLERKCSC